MEIQKEENKWIIEPESEIERNALDRIVDRLKKVDADKKTPDLRIEKRLYAYIEMVLDMADLSFDTANNMPDLISGRLQDLGRVMKLRHFYRTFDGRLDTEDNNVNRVCRVPSEN